MNDAAQLAAGRTPRARIKMVESLRHANIKALRPLIGEIVREGPYQALGGLMHRVVMIGAMHSMDPYNFDSERAQRCGIHYAIPDGRIIPFCAMNNLHREKIERQFAKRAQTIPAS